MKLPFNPTKPTSGGGGIYSGIKGSLISPSSAACHDPQCFNNLFFKAAVAETDSEAAGGARDEF